MSTSTLENILKDKYPLFVQFCNASSSTVSLVMENGEIVGARDENGSEIRF